MLGKKTTLVSLICAKTKIKPVDVIDMLRVLPECMAETFVLANPEPGEVIDLVGISAYWRKGGCWGPQVKGRPAKAFKSALVKLKHEGKHPFAKYLYSLMHPRNKAQVEARIKKQAANMVTIKF